MSTSHRTPVGGEASPPAGVPADLNKVVGARVSEALRAAGRSQGQLADALGITQSGVSRKLAGENSWRLADLYAVAQWLGVPVESLTPDETDPAVAS